MARAFKEHHVESHKHDSDDSSDAASPKGRLHFITKTFKAQLESREHDDGYRPGSDPPNPQGQPFDIEPENHAPFLVAEMHESGVDDNASCANPITPNVDPTSDVDSTTAAPEFSCPAPSSVEPVTRGGGGNEVRPMEVENTMSNLLSTYTYPTGWGNGGTATARLAGQATAEVQRLPPAQLRDPASHFAVDMEMVYSGREGRGVIPIETPANRYPTRREHPRIICVATLVIVGLAIVTFLSHCVAFLIHKTLF